MPILDELEPPTHQVVQCNLTLSSVNSSFLGEICV